MKICVRCGSENSSDYKYCKFCGAELPCVDEKAERSYRQGASDDGIDFSPESENITIPEIDRFVGKNYEQITPKFVTIQQKGKRFMWCLPAFLFGLFFGLPGVAIWFLYRKMVKPAALILAASLIMECITMCFSFSALCELYRVLFDGFEQYGAMLGENPTLATEWLSNYIYSIVEWAESSVTSAASVVIDFVNTYIVSLAAPIILSLLGWFLYKKHTLKKISEIKRTSGDKMHYVVRLTREGGTSVGSAVLGIAIYLMISFAISLAPLIAVLFG